MDDVLVVGIASSYLVVLLKDLDGPFGLVDRLRSWLIRTNPGLFAGLFDCVWCLGTWVGLCVALAYVLAFGLNIYRLPFLWWASIPIVVAIYKLLID